MGRSLIIGSFEKVLVFGESLVNLVLVKIEFFIGFFIRLLEKLLVCERLLVFVDVFFTGRFGCGCIGFVELG